MKTIMFFLFFSFMKQVSIPKRSGGERIIYIQDPREKHKYRYLGYLLSEFYRKYGNGVAHGFVEGRSPVSNALQHVNKQYTLSIDLKDFFDSIDEKHLIEVGVDSKLARRVCYEGTIKQGLSSSPPASNCAAIPLDKRILGLLNILSLSRSVIYTRYADDLIFSCDDLPALLYLRNEVLRLVELSGFQVNIKKVRIQSARFGRRYITGIAVDDNIHPTRKQKRNLRAAQHNLIRLCKLLSFLLRINLLVPLSIILEINRKNIARFRGLNEWCKLKLPTRSLDGKLYSTYVYVESKRAFKD